VLSLLGAGGMAKSTARDTKLGRDVAIKVLPDALASDPDRIARFEREAKALAALNHPHIAALYGMEESSGRNFLIMELVEGETVEERLRRGALLPRDAIRIACQIAEAVEAAHERNVIHRDLKPANVKNTPDDQVKVLDFGLAKLNDPNVPNDPNVVTNSPMLSMMATQAGVIFGTAAYMSPNRRRVRSPISAAIFSRSARCSSR
jgi:eukaryotic-like serine/threonine-protein kinase